MEPVQGEEGSVRPGSSGQASADQGPGAAGTVPVALQLYTVRDQTERDFAGTLERVAEIGFPGVEFAGYGGFDAGQLRDLLERLGLAAAGAHVSLAALEADAAREIEYCLAIGCD